MIALSFDLLSFPFPVFRTKSTGSTRISFHCCWLFSPGAASSPQSQYLNRGVKFSGPAAPELFHESALDTKLCRPKEGVWREQARSSSMNLPEVAVEQPGQLMGPVD